MTTQTLSVSKNYSIEHEYEVVYLRTPDGRRIVVGDFYGDPEAALIDCNEKWCVIGGQGLIVYSLREPFCEYGLGIKNNQFQEFNREAPNIWWITEIIQLGSYEIEVRLDDGSTRTISFSRPS